MNRVALNSLILPCCCVSGSSTPGRTIIKPAIHLGRLGFDRFQLVWDPEPFMKRGVELIELTTTQIGNPHRMQRGGADIRRGEVEIRNLYPNTLYAVDLTGNRDFYTVVFTYNTTIRTQTTGKFFSAYLHCACLHSCVETSVAKLKQASEMLVGVGLT